LNACSDSCAIVQSRARRSLGIDSRKRWNAIADQAGLLRAYGAWGEKKLYGKVLEGVIRSTVVVGPDGRVTLSQYNVKATGHVGRLRRELAPA